MNQRQRLDFHRIESSGRTANDYRPGDLYFLNDRWIMHNRTAIEHHAELAHKRHLARLWLRRPEAVQGSPR